MRTPTFHPLWLTGLAILVLLVLLMCGCVTDNTQYHFGPVPPPSRGTNLVLIPTPPVLRASFQISRRAPASGAAMPSLRDAHTNPDPPMPLVSGKRSVVADVRVPPTNGLPRVEVKYFGLHTNTLILEASPDFREWVHVTTFPPGYGTIDWPAGRATNPTQFYRLEKIQ
ncbi:MAG TPA: hypothetical protein VN281_14720 [Verrucomicrobiae bacterium]|nr:hypothetical protein [Verrucomicrobiae bacterium]